MILCFVHCKIHLVACGLGQLLMLYVLSYCLPGFFLEFKSDSKENYFLSKNIFLKIKKKKKTEREKKQMAFQTLEPSLEVLYMLFRSIFSEIQHFPKPIST